ncbi:hypothetical protein ACQ4PT_063897 [Festuca glaucescens]
MASLDQLDSTPALSLLFVVSCFFVVVIVKGFGTRRKDGDRSAPPSPPALPVIGNLHQLGSGHLHRRLHALAQSYGPLFLLRLGSAPTLVDMFLAGTDTPYKTIEWTMAELMKNPREMEKVQAQVRQVARAQGGVHEEELGKMSMLHAAIKEALRLHPPVPLLTPRETIQDTLLHGYDIQARSRVLINAWAIGRDIDSWENATEFRPERFLDRAIDYSGKDPRFIPFGAGRRGCPSTAFGTRLVEL